MRGSVPAIAMVKKIPLGELSRVIVGSPGPGSPLVVKPVGANAESLKTFEEWMKIAADNVCKLTGLENHIQKHMVGLAD